MSIAYERFKKQNEACLKGDMATVKKIAYEAREELEKNDFIKTDLLGWIEKEWLGKGLSEGAIVLKNGSYFPVAIERVENIVDGYKGRNPIIKGKKSVLDFFGFSDFLRRYEEYGNKKEKQQFAINMEFRNLIEGGEKKNGY